MKNITTRKGDVFMSKIKAIELQCKKCGKLIPSMIFVDSTESLESNRIEGNSQNCPHCNHTDSYGKNDMKITLEF